MVHKTHREPKLEILQKNMYILDKDELYYLVNILNHTYSCTYVAEIWFKQIGQCKNKKMRYEKQNKSRKNKKQTNKGTNEKQTLI